MVLQNKISEGFTFHLSDVILIVSSGKFTDVCGTSEKANKILKVGPEKVKTDWVRVKIELNA